MKNKTVQKGKKRSLSETSVSIKPEKKKNAVKSKGSPKKPKLADSVRNGKLTQKIKEQAIKEIAANQVKLQPKRGKQQNNTAESSRQEIKSAKQKTKLTVTEAKEKMNVDKKLALLEKKTAKHTPATETQAKEKSKKYAQLNEKQLKKRIEDIMSRETISKTAKKKLQVLNNRLKHLTGSEIVTTLKTVRTMEKNNKKDKQLEVMKNKQKTDDKTQAKKELQNKKAEELEEDDSDLVEDENDSDEDQIDSEEEEKEEEEEEDDDSVDIDDEDEEEEEEESDDDEIEEKNSKQMQNKKMEAAQYSTQKLGRVGKKTQPGIFQKSGKFASGIQGKKNPGKKGQ